jgi:predicted RNA-binding protein YlqC (UPF0109 family)
MSEANGDVRALLEHVARALVEAPNEVIVEAFDEDGATVVELEVAESDMGRVIGRQGRTARAMRNLLHAIGDKHDCDYELEILE